jgi:diadenosine tetraphosphate (Ap4A) HIT family hydrolase
LTPDEISDLSEATTYTANYLETEKRAEGINLHSHDGNTDAGEYYVHMIPRNTGDIENNDEVYGIIDAYDISILSKFK